MSVFAVLLCFVARDRGTVGMGGGREMLFHIDDPPTPENERKMRVLCSRTSCLVLGVTLAVPCAVLCLM